MSVVFPEPFVPPWDWTVVDLLEHVGCVPSERLWVGNRSRGGKEGDRSMFSANVFAAEIHQLAEKWTSPRPPRERLPGWWRRLKGEDKTDQGGHEQESFRGKSADRAMQKEVDCEYEPSDDRWSY